MPNRLQRRNVGKDGHWYLFDSKYAPGVTTVLGTGLAVPFSVGSNWAARLVAQFVADNTEWITSAPNKQFIIDGLRAIPNNTRDEAAVKGKHCHNYAEQLHDTGQLELPPEHEHYAPYVQAVADLLDEYDITSHHVEIPLALTTLKVCGTTDVIASSPAIAATVNRMRIEAGMPLIADNALGVIDYKFGNALRDKDSVQVETYRRADLAHLDGVEQPMPPLEWSALIHGRADGATLEIVHPAYQDALFRLFRAALYEWEALDQKRGWITAARRPAEELLAMNPAQETAA